MSSERISTKNWNPNYVRNLLTGMAVTPIQKSGRNWSQVEMEALCERMEMTSKIFRWLVKGLLKSQKRLVKKSGNKKTSTTHVNRKLKKPFEKKCPDAHASSSDAESAVAKDQFDPSEWYTQADLRRLDI